MTLRARPLERRSTPSLCQAAARRGLTPPPPQRSPAERDAIPGREAAGGLARRLAGRGARGTRAGEGAGTCAKAARPARGARARCLNEPGLPAPATSVEPVPRLRVERPYCPAPRVSAPLLPGGRWDGAPRSRRQCPSGGSGSAGALQGTRACRAAGPEPCSVERQPCDRRWGQSGAAIAPGRESRASASASAHSAPREAPGRSGTWPWSSSARSSKVSAQGPCTAPPAG